MDDRDKQIRDHLRKVRKTVSPVAGKIGAAQKLIRRAAGAYSNMRYGANNVIQGGRATGKRVPGGTKRFAPKPLTKRQLKRRGIK